MRSQASFEYMTIVAVVLLVVLPLVGYFYVYTSSSVQISQAQETVRKITNAVEYVASGGPGTSTTVYVDVPSMASDFFVGNHTVMIKLDIPTGHTEVYETTDVPVYGYIQYLPGGRAEVKITNMGDHVQVGEGMEFSLFPLQIELSTGEYGTYNENITSLLPFFTPLSYSLEGEHTDWVSVSNFPNGINPGETKTFQVNVNIPDDAESGEYYLNLVSHSNVTDDSLPIILKVLGMIHSVVVKFYSDAGYTHEVNKFFPGDTVYYKITVFDVNNNELPADVNYNLKAANGTVVNSTSYHSDVYYGKYSLNSNWSKVHGVWNLSASATRIYTVNNQSSFEVKATLLTDLNYSCDELTGPVHWWNDSWYNREKITLYNSLNSDLNNFQVKLVVNHEPGMKSDYSDLRFVYWNGTSNVKLNYYVESHNSNKATVWVKVPKLKAKENTVIYVYYNNSNAVSESNPYGVFDFYDDFNSIDTSKWDILSGTQYTISNGILKIKRGSFGLNTPLTFNFEDGYLLESKLEYNSYSETEYSGDLQTSSSKFVASGNANSDAVVLYMVRSGHNKKTVRAWVGSGSTDDYDITSGDNIFNSQKNKWYVLGIGVNSTGVYLYKDNSLEKKYSASWSKPMKWLSIGSFYGDGYDNIKDTSYDWIRVRKFAKQPSVSFGQIDKLSDQIKCEINWWNDSWKYRRWVDIKDTTGTDRTNLPIKINLNENNINFSATNGNDIRVIFNGNKIPYWISSWNTNTKTATIWVKLPYLHADSTDRIWIYYGNPSAGSESSSSAVFYSDNMEHGDSNWTYTGLWHITTKRYNSPSHSFWYGQESTGDYDTGSANSGYLETKHWIKLYDHPVLYYWEYRETEENPDYDHTYVQISTDNSSWTTLDNSYDNDYGSIKSIDLSDYANKKVLIRFYFDTVDSWYNNYEGWYIDDFKIRDYADVDITAESDAFSGKPVHELSWHLKPLNQFDNNVNGHLKYQIYINGTLYKQGSEYTNDLSGSLPLNSSVIGDWTFNGIWDDISLVNSTSFVVGNT